ncbi:MAG: hypothetical protein ABEJ27_07100 [Halodesulfurarchaeum sp.]
MSVRSDRPFIFGSIIVVIAGLLLAATTPLVAGAAAAFRGSVVASAVVGLVFAVQHQRRFQRDGRPHVPDAAVSTVFGAWFIAAPLLYDVGFIATAGVQFAGLLVAAFGGYLTLAAIVDTESRPGR